jgi:hypothetical protein
LAVGKDWPPSSNVHDVAMIDYRALKEWPFEDIEHKYDERDTSLYALGLGLGADPLDETELSFVYERSLRALPTMAVVLGYPGF